MIATIETQWTMYAQNPEECDTQGYYLKAQGEPEPWTTETDSEEFDGWLEPSEAGYYIRDLETANRAAQEAGYHGTVVRLEWW